MEVKKIKRDHFAWGVYDIENETFLEMFETKKEAEAYLEKITKAS